MLKAVAPSLNDLLVAGSITDSKLLQLTPEPNIDNKNEHII